MWVEGRTMANWITADEIAEIYAVGPQRLAAYAMRGNLPWRRQGDATLYDEAVVQRLFRPRRGGIVVTRAHAGAHLGVLGVSHMGDAPVTAESGEVELPPSLRGERRRRTTVSDVVPRFAGADKDVVVPLFGRKRA
jgi:hypothetical protein